jgi:hypothetical protein
MRGRRAERRKSLAQPLEPRSVYIPAWAEPDGWEHHIPLAPSRRFSITFRTLRAKA